MRAAFALLPAQFAALFVAPALAADFEVTGPADTALVRDLDAAVDAATETIGTCREAGATLETCLCEGRPEIAAVRGALDAAIAAHPEWEGKALFLADDGEGRALTIFLDTVARMTAPPACP